MIKLINQNRLHFQGERLAWYQSDAFSIANWPGLKMAVAPSRLTVVSREAKEEVPCDCLSTNAREYFTRTNLVKIKKCHN